MKARGLVRPLGNLNVKVILMEGGFQFRGNFSGGEGNAASVAGPDSFAKLLILGEGTIFGGGVFFEIWAGRVFVS
jgi:hypothetical protein